MNQFSKAIILENRQEKRHILNDILIETIPEIEIHEAATIRCARQCLYEQKSFDLAFVEIDLPDGNGINYVKELINQSPTSYIVMFTIYDDDEHLFNSLRAGANGYLLKKHSKTELATMLHGILDGQPPLSPGIAQHILDSFHKPLPNKRLNLKPREVEILTLLAKGFNRTEIADLLRLTVNTVSWYIKKVYQKLDVHSRAEATLEATRMGFVQ